MLASSGWVHPASPTPPGPPFDPDGMDVGGEDKLKLLKLEGRRGPMLNDPC